MHKEHPIPKTPATKAPKVDSFVTEYLESNFPKSEDAKLLKVQSVLLKVCGPMVCMWAKLMDNNLLSDPDAKVNVYNVLNIIQRTMVLLDNATKIMPKLRSSKILAAIVAVACHPMVSCLLRGTFNLRPPSPHYSYSWDFRVAVNFQCHYKSADLSNL